MAACTQCGQPMRAYGVHKRDAPGTVATGAGGLCTSCYYRQGNTSAPVVDDAPCVLVRVDLRPSTFAAFQQRAHELGVTPAMVLSKLADKAVQSPPAPRVPRAARRYATPELLERIRTLNGEGHSDGAIARMIGLGQPSVSRHRRRMGLESPTPRPGGWKKASTGG